MRWKRRCFIIGHLENFVFVWFYLAILIGKKFRSSNSLTHIWMENGMG